MFAVTATRRWLIAAVVFWILVVTGLGLWSVWNDPATVPEQRSAAEAMPVLEEATGAIFAAATAGDDRVVELSEVRVRRDCSLTPVRSGVEATRDVLVHVRGDGALAVLKQIASALPAGYQARAGASSGGRRVGLEADAGGFVAIDARGDASAQQLLIEATTGCRPAGELRLSPAESAPPPARVQSVLGALGQARSAAAGVSKVACPDGGSGRTYTVDGVPAPGNLDQALRPVIGDAPVVRGEPAAWAWRAGDEGVSVVKSGNALRVSLTTPCA